MATFDAVMTEATDSFQYIFQNLKQNDHYVGNLEYGSRQKPQRYKCGKKIYARYEKRGVILHEKCSTS